MIRPLRTASPLMAFLAFTAGPASAQMAPSTSDPPQLVGLFVQACVRFAGDPQALRAWIAAHNLPAVPAAQAVPFLSVGPGEAFGASTLSGKHALNSYDSGACEVIGLADDPAATQQLLLNRLQGLGVLVSRLETKAKPDGSSTQSLFEATLGSRRWLLSLTAKPHSDAPNLQPELGLLATPG